MRRFFASALVLGLLSTVGLVGCGEEAGVERETTIEGPGGTTTYTEEQTIHSEGDQPPVPLTPDQTTPGLD